MNYHYDYAVIGGDNRQTYLTELLSQKGRTVCHYGLCRDAARFSKDLSGHQASSPEESISAASILVAPTPFSKQNRFLNLQPSSKALPIESLLECLTAGQFLFGGGIPDWFLEKATEKNVHVFDLLKDDSLRRFNTIATAEGAICEALKESPLNLQGSRCAILGYGYCGTTLAVYLKGMFCRTFVVTNDKAQRAQAALLGAQTGSLEDFYEVLESFEFIFNTIPAVVLREEHLKKLNPEVTIIDIASAPGGLDHKLAAQLGIRAKLCPGLPGIYAPKASAEAILKTIERILKEESTCL